MLFTPFLFEKIALVGGLLHTMVPGAAPFAGTLLIDRGQIEAIGVGIEVPAGAKKIDITGKHVIPGLIEGMANFDADHDRLYLSRGVTLVRETGADLTQMLAERELYARERNPGPSLFIAGAVLDGSPPATYNAVVMMSAVEANEKASRLVHPEAGSGIDYFSYYVGLPKESWQSVLTLAHGDAPPWQVWGMLPRGVTLDQALKAGQDGIFHIDFLLPSGKRWSDLSDADIEDIARRVGESRTAITPTLALYASLLRPPPERAQEALQYLGPVQAAQWLLVASKRGQELKAQPERLAQGLADLKQRVALLRALHAHHVALVPGSDCGLAPWLVPGESLLDELSLWAGMAGMGASEVLHLATHASALRIGAGKDHGSLEAGKWADLVVTTQDPEQDIRALHDPDYVAIRGRVFDANDLSELRRGLAARQQELQALACKPLELPPPTQPAGEPLLSGLVETRYQGQRVSGESFAVARMSDGSMVYAGRALTFGTATTADTLCELRERILDGRLIELDMSVTHGPRVFTLKGTLAGGTLNIERFLNGVQQDMPRIRESVAFLDAGSVLTDLILGQSVKPGSFKALWMDDYQIAVSDKWQLAVDPSNGQHLLNSPIGSRVVEFATDGAPKSSTRESGRGTLVRTLIEDKPVGAGLPVPKKENPK
ncbi:MAG: amidohydrolase family protein [Planctomycetes bacterium]|nr:amidohydrolase family protein [Planctomycetota bacterium]